MGRIRWPLPDRSQFYASGFARLTMSFLPLAGSFRAALKSWQIEPARRRVRNETAQILPPRALVEQSIVNERDQVVEFIRREPNGNGEQRIEPEQYRLDWAESISQIIVDTREFRMVGPGRPEHIEMVLDRVI